MIPEIVEPQAEEDVFHELNQLHACAKLLVVQNHRQINRTQGTVRCKFIQQVTQTDMRPAKALPDFVQCPCMGHEVSRDKPISRPQIVKLRRHVRNIPGWNAVAKRDVSDMLS